MLAGVIVQELRGQFEIKNFEATCSVKSAAKDGADGEATKYVEIQSGQLLGSAGQHFRLIVDWEVKQDPNPKAKALIPDSESFLGVKLHVARDGPPAYYVKFEAELINVDPAKSEKRCFPNFRKVARGASRGWSPSVGNGSGFLKLSDIFDPSKGWLQAGALRVGAKLLIASDDEPKADHSAERDPVQGLSKDLGAFFATGRHTDVTIVVKGEQIQAHSVILMARSSVFAAMLSSPMCEGKERVISIGDLEVAAVKAAIGFLYTGEIDGQVLESDDTALGILEVGHRYDVPTLVSLSVQALTRRFDVRTVSEWFHLADLIGNVEFRTRCLEYIRERITEVQGTESFEKFVGKKPELLKEILASLFPPAKRQRIENVE